MEKEHKQVIAQCLSSRHLIAEHWLTLGLYVTMSVTLWNAISLDVTSRHFGMQLQSFCADAHYHLNHMVF